jgi:anti-sigma regulatory factor (Ser/Thr protein kinase)
MDDETVLVVSRSCVTTAPSGAGATADPRTALEAPAALIARARHDGHHLSLGTHLGELVGLRAWLHDHPDLRALPQEASRRLESALYELCANIIEHGYGDDGESHFDLWWVPASGRHPDDGSDAAATDGRSGDRARIARVRDGLFVIREHGRTFDPAQRERPDLGDPVVRRRGRGLGLEMVYRSMACMEYRGSTSEGNLTIMRFDPARAMDTTSEV